MKQKKFALIDQSVKKAGGHHLEYALRVLAAAKSNGYQTVLGTGKTFSAKEDLPHEIVSCFRYTFWENLIRESAASKLLLRYGEWRQELRRRSHARELQKKYERHYSKTGLDQQRALELPSLRHELMEIYASELSPLPSRRHVLAWHRYRADYRNRFLSFIESCIALYRSFPRPIRLPIHYAKRITFKVLRILRVALRRFVKLIVAIAVAPIAVLIGPFMLGKPHRPAFVEDLKTFIKSSKLGRGDIAFVPTLGETEMLAIADLCARYPRARGIRWRLLFRRDLFSGRSIHHASQGDYVPSRRFRLALQEVKRKTDGVDIAFSTDTEALTKQYNRPNTFPFKTVPIPVDGVFNDVHKSRTSDPLTVSYLGDARDEKGFPLLAETIDQVFQSHIANGKAMLMAQSNFNVEGGEPGSVESKLALHALPSRVRDLVEGPFSSEEYFSFFAKSDVMLVPYDPEAYASRSSGVFAESLVGGVPTIVTRGSWMAMILEPYRQAYCEILDNKLPTESNFVDPEGTQRVLQRKSLGEATLGDIGSLEGFEFCSHLFVRLDFPRVDDELHISISAKFFDVHGEHIDDVDETLWLCRRTMRCFIRIPNKAVTAKLSAFPLDGVTKVVPDVVSVRLVGLPKNQPASFAGVIVEPSASGIANGLREICDNYELFRAAATHISARWRDYCDSGTLISLLERNDKNEASPEFFATADVEAMLESALFEGHSAFGANSTSGKARQ